MTPHLLLWGKSAPNGTARYHPLACHCLDVAAVASGLIAEDRRRFERLSRAVGIEPIALRKLTLWLVALHDVGKASRAFQWKVEELWPTGLLGHRPQALSSNARHDALTAWFFIESGLRDKLERFTPGWARAHRRYLVNAIAGHHGRPVEAGPGDAVGDAARGLGEALAGDLAELLDVQPVVPGSFDSDDPVVLLAWYLATLVPLSDWVGSRADWFPPAGDLEADLPEVAAYWHERAQRQAEDALGQSGVRVARAASLGNERILPKGAEPSPLQAWAARVNLPTGGPVLAVLEDATGSGKTEAAVILAHRMMNAGLATGFYVALPTMATANAMYDRLGAVYESLFELEARPSLVLVHGRAKRRFDAWVSAPGASPGELLNSGKGEDGAAYCNEWIADDRRKAFLAPAGAGTIDQAVLAVLPSKYQTLRLRGLADKVLIVDEAHTYDAYVSAEVEGLLRFHAAQGGSAAILSATLPSKTRGRLVDAFAKGAGWPMQPVARSAYPLATLGTADGLTEEALATRPENDRTVRVERIPAVEEGEAMALNLAARGGAVAVIRSTVDAAIETYGRLSSAGAECGITVDLFHARFLPAHREEIERTVMRRFGKEASNAARARCILVATQVIEQSLDIDFDAMVTDLAPVDLLIQRAGRLWRHRYRNPDRPVSEPVLRVICPDLPEKPNEKWLDEGLREAAVVYRNPSLLWQSANTLFKAGRIVSGPLAEGDHNPAHVRSLVEEVYGKDADHLPEGLFEAAMKAEGVELGIRSLATQFTLSPAEPYGPSTRAWSGDAVVQTRLDDGSRTVRLAREDGARIIPLSATAGEADWSASELRLRPRLSAKLNAPTSDQLGRLDPSWAEADREVPLLLMRGDAEDALSVSEPALRYNRSLGLTAADER